MAARDPKSPVDTVNDYPACPSIVARCRDHVRNGLPNYVSMTDPGRDGVDVFAFGSAYLGPAYVPFSVPGDPSKADFKVPNITLDNRISDRLTDRQLLLTGFDKVRRAVDSSGMMDAMDDFNGRALSMLTSSRTREAFDLSKEPESTKERYGKHAWGMRALVARRLVEAGCSFVTLVMENPYQSGVTQLKQGVYNWDFPCCELPHLGRCSGAFPDLRSGRDRSDRGHLRPRDRQEDSARRDRRIRSDSARREQYWHPDRSDAARSRSLAQLDVADRLRRRPPHGSGDWLDEQQGRSPQRPPADSRRSVGDRLPPSGIDYNQSFLDHAGRPTQILTDGTPISELI